VTKEEKYQNIYIRTAILFSEMSWAKRKKVGAIIVKDGIIISQGWNGTPSGFDNSCEEIVWEPNEGPWGDQGKYVFKTKAEVIHAEMNALLKCARSNVSSKGGTLYVTLSPCIECSKAILQSGIAEVYYLEEYRDTSGINFLKKAGLTVNKIDL
jgi:dCMP deaminase